MNALTSVALPDTCHHAVPDSLLEELPWIPTATPGKTFKPLRILPGNAGFVELLRMEPGALMPLHRHTGDVHAFNVSGMRELCSGEVIGAGGYVYEPAGNTDWWRVVGDEPMVVYVIVMGEVEFLKPDGSVGARSSAKTLLDDYLRYCRDNDVPLRNLQEGP